MPVRGDNRGIVQRIEAGLKQVRKSPRRASIEAGYGPDLIRDLQRKPKTMPTVDAIEALAPVLNMTPEFLAFASRAPGRGRAPKRMPIKGEVAAGLWLDIDGFEDREFPDFPVPFHPNYPEEGQFGLIVVGTSINRIAQPGDVLQCLDRGISGIEPQGGDLVIVERRRAQGGQKEVTAKLYRPKGRIVELVPDSTEKRWREPIVYDPRRASGDEEVAIIAIVIGVYKPMRRR